MRQASGPAERVQTLKALANIYGELKTEGNSLPARHIEHVRPRRRRWTFEPGVLTAKRDRVEIGSRSCRQTAGIHHSDGERLMQRHHQRRAKPIVSLQGVGDRSFDSRLPTGGAAVAARKPETTSERP